MFDLHNDFPTALAASAHSEYIKSLGRGNYATAVIWTSEFDRDDAKRRVDEITTALRRIGKFPIAIEDIGFLDGDYDKFPFERYFYCSLTWNGNNRFAGGALGDGRLTSDGRAVISSMNGKCALDLAHLNKKSFFDALDLAKDPICSHTAFGTHRRCLDNEQIRALVERNAPIGLCAVKSFTGADTAHELAVVIDRFVQCYGIDLLCLGTDFYGSDDLPYDFKSYSNMFNLEKALFDLGYSSDNILKIFHENAYKFYTEHR